MKAAQKEISQVSEQPSINTDQVVAALAQANDRIRELEQLVLSLRTELEQSQKRKLPHGRVDFSWLAMA
ncbi:MAG: hypothetical protein ACI9R3_004055 [Verrucomicrobiales bacterium]|jgi:hypothetical protein